ncbi:hypothetical protein Lal_00033449 [Lupinus albus]|nr:hypothetical protein Lal_00033449 [Lupinus albus]
MEAQGTIQFMELKGQVYPALVREFYANFRYKDGKYWSMISGNLFELNDEIFMNVGGDCSWVKENFDPTEVYKLLHYIIAYILVQRNTNHAQPTVNDLRFMYAVKNNSKLLPYSIFISRIVDYLRIDVSDTIIVEYTDKDHLVGESLIHKMGIYKYGSTWQYQEDYTTIGLDLSDDDNQDGQIISMLQLRGSLLDQHLRTLLLASDQLEAMEQRLNNRMDLHFQGLKRLILSGMEQYEERQTAYSDNQFRELRNLIQSTAEAPECLVLFRISEAICAYQGDQTLSFLLITLTILILHLNLSLEDFRPRISYLRLIVITASDICAIIINLGQHNLQAIFITAVTFDVEFSSQKRGD